ncbi:MAG: PhzF family phenazine biosynthesis protein [Nocardioidaceae bacterium]|nr:PhzF family phenazine biosynthesis protein [Nocardioidaceae bacterium]
MPAEQLTYEVVDVFTDRAFAGNPLAVVYGTQSFSDSQLLALAMEFNLSETTFPQPLTDADRAKGVDYGVRIFTPAGELPFAGHPTLGTAWALRQRGLIGVGARVQSCGAGLIGVDVPADPQGLVSLTATPRDAARELQEGQRDEVASAVGAGRGDIVGSTYLAGCGLTWAYLRVTPDAVARARPSSRRMPEMDLGQDSLVDPLEGVCVYAVSDAEAAAAPRAGDALADLNVNARVFVPGLSIPEDPATGSAAVGLGLALVAAGMARPDGQTSYRITQGTDMGRPSLLLGTVEAQGGVGVRCHVAGRVVAVASGTIAVPPERS